jgi:hypothetical protein
MSQMLAGHVVCWQMPFKAAVPSIQLTQELRASFGVPKEPQLTQNPFSALSPHPQKQSADTQVASGSCSLPVDPCEAVLSGRAAGYLIVPTEHQSQASRAALATWPPGQLSQKPLRATSPVRHLSTAVTQVANGSCSLPMDP